MAVRNVVCVTGAPRTVHGVECSPYALRTAPDPVLSAPSRPVERFDTDLAALSAEMCSAMHRLGGVGLAAVQIGVPLRVFVASVAGSDLVYVNPVLVSASGSYRPAEGCLSIPGFSYEPVRPLSVELQWFDLDGTSHSGSFTGLHAEIISHEMDHLDGILIPDRMVIGRDW